MGFSVARTTNGSGSGWVSLPIVTCRSCIASSSADCTLAGVVKARADEVGRNEVGGELDSAGGAADHLGKGLDRDGLGKTGHPFEQDVAAGQQCDQQTLEQPVLADDQALDLEQDLLDGRRNSGGELARGVGRAYGFLASPERLIDHETLQYMAVHRLNLVEMSPF